MAETINLARQMEKQLPAELVNFMSTAGRVAASQGQSLYLVGGVVRDLLLGRTNLDLDLVVEGDAIKLAQRLAGIIPGKIITHPRFQTAKIKWAQWSVDLATARSETYDRPGALPRVQPGSFASDLFRRDFSINAMAIELTTSRYGQLIDLYGGREDLEQKLIRILHDRSFLDDATRIWRGLRYQQRLNFQLEANTLKLLKRGIPMLDTISGDRLRHELELVLKEEFPERILQRAEELGVLAKLHPSLRGNGWLAEKLAQARRLSHPEIPPVGLYLALLCYRLTKEEAEELIRRLRLPKLLAQTLRDSHKIKAELEVLADAKLKPSRLYHLLHDRSSTALVANSLSTDSAVVRQHIQNFLSKLRYIKPALTGDDLIKMGLTPGPRMKEILQRLHEARLEGKVTSKQGETELVREWLRKAK